MALRRRSIQDLGYELPRIHLLGRWVNKGEEKGRGCQQVSSPQAPAARLARLVPGERAVHPLGRGRRWEFAGRGQRTPTGGHASTDVPRAHPAPA